jgi:hypothetical protein
MSAMRPSMKQKRWGGIFAVIALAAAVLFGRYWLRGSWAEDARDPAGEAEGLVTQVVLSEDGRKVVRCARVAAAPAETVRAVVTDYARFPELFPMLRDFQSQAAADGSHRLSYTVDALGRAWDFDVEVRHRSTPGLYVDSWSGSSPHVPVQRGSWAIRALDAERALVVYTLDVEAAGIPGFIVRNEVRHFIERIVADVVAAASRRARGPL